MIMSQDDTCRQACKVQDAVRRTTLLASSRTIAAPLILNLGIISNLRNG